MKEPSNFAFEVGSCCILHSQPFPVSELDTSPCHSSFVGFICCAQAAFFFWPSRIPGLCCLPDVAAGAVRSSPHVPLTLPLHFLPLGQTSSMQRHFSRNINHSGAWRGKKTQKCSTWAVSESSQNLCVAPLLPEIVSN